MLSDHDKLIIEEVVERVVDKRVDRVENKIDKVLKMFVDLKQEHTIAKAKIDKHDKRLRKIEKKLKISSPSESIIFT